MRIDGISGLQQPAGPTTHTAQEGETLHSIANLHNISADQLANANFLSLDSQISAGQELIIPLANPKVSADVALYSNGFLPELDSLESGGATLTAFNSDFNPESFSAMKLMPAESELENIAAMKLTPQDADLENLAAMKLMPAESELESFSAMKLMPQENDFESLAAMKLSPNVYTAQEGDTLESIAAKLNVQTDALAAANDLQQGISIPAGTELKLPQE